MARTKEKTGTAEPAPRTDRKTVRHSGQFFWTKKHLQFHSCGPKCCDTQPKGDFDIPPMTRLEMAKPPDHMKAELERKWRSGDKFLPMIIFDRIRIVGRENMMTEAEHDQHVEEQKRKLVSLRSQPAGPVGEGGPGG